MIKLRGAIHSFDVKRSCFPHFKTSLAKLYSHDQEEGESEVLATLWLISKLCTGLRNFFLINHLFIFSKQRILVFMFFLLITQIVSSHVLGKYSENLYEENLYLKFAGGSAECF